MIFPRERDTFPDESGKSEDARNGRQGHLPDGFGPGEGLLFGASQHESRWPNKKRP